LRNSGVFTSFIFEVDDTRSLKRKVIVMAYTLFHEWNARLKDICR